MAIDFPTGDPNLPTAATTGESLGTMHGGSGHPAATNRLLANIKALGAKLGYGASLPGAAAGLLRRTASGQSAWGQILAGDYGPGSIVNADVAAGAAIAKSKLAALAVADADVASGAAIGLAKLAHVGAGNVFKSNGTINAAGQVLGGDIALGTIAGGVSGNIAGATITDINIAPAAAIAVSKLGGGGTPYRLFGSTDGVNAGPMQLHDLMVPTGGLTVGRLYAPPSGVYVVRTDGAGSTIFSTLNGEEIQYGAVSQFVFAQAATAFSAGPNAWGFDTSGLFPSINNVTGNLLVIFSGSFSSNVPSAAFRIGLIRWGAAAPDFSITVHTPPAANQGVNGAIAGKFTVVGSFYYTVAIFPIGAHTVSWMQDGNRTLTLIELKK